MNAGTLPEQIGPFRPVEEIGRGGTSVVFRAERAEGFQQQVAIKVLYAALPEEQGEENVLRSLDHPGIVRLLDRGRLPDGTPYLVMDLVEGEPVTRHCSEVRASMEARLRLVLQMAEALTYAHERLVSHGDLKPANVLVTSSGEVRLIDFGMAGWAPGAPGGASRYTEEFSDPAQRLGAGPSIAGDVYSVGRILAVLMSEAAEPVPAEVQAVIAKATRINSEGRYGSVRAMAADVQAFLERRPVLAYRQDRFYRTRRWISRNRVTATAVAALLLLVVLSTATIVATTLRAARGRRLAQERLQELMGLTGTLEGELYKSLPEQPGADAARKALLQHVSDTLADLRQEGGTDRPFLRTLAAQYTRLSALERADGDIAGAGRDAAVAENLIHQAR